MVMLVLLIMRPIMVFTGRDAGSHGSGSHSAGFVMELLALVPLVH